MQSRPKRTAIRRKPAVPSQKIPPAASGISATGSEPLLLAAQRALIDCLPDVTWIKDHEGRLTLVNRAFAERYGISPEDAIGKTDFDIYPADKAAQLREEDLRVMATREPLRYESTLTVEGRERWVEIVKAPIMDATGAVSGTVGTSRDISARKSAEQVSDRAQQRLELALEGSGLALWDTDLRSGEVHLSDGWSRLLGGEPGETRTSVEKLMALVHPDDLPAALELSMECLRGDRDDYATEHRVRTAGGQWKWIVSRGRVTARDASGRALRMTGTNLDITRRKSMEESLRQALEQSDTLLETTPTAIAVVHDGVINRCNAAMNRMFGFSSQPVRPMAALFPSTAAWAHAKERIDAALSDKQSFNGELELKRSDGTRFWVVAAARPVQAGAAEILLALTDVTEQRMLAKELESAKEAADAANRAKSGFLATMSHEIRTPMNGVLGMLELLELTRLNPEQRESLTLARSSAVSLLRLIDDILDFSKIEAGQLEIKPEPVSLQTLANRAINVHHELATRKGLELKCLVDPELATAHIGDGLRITQILNNLLSNAIKFTEKGSVRLSVDCVRHEETHDLLRISVRDTGIGIPPEQQTRLFQPFVQGDSETTRRFGGTGLGLSICRRLALLMGGDVTLDSSPGIGTEVSTTLKLAVASADLLRQQQQELASGNIRETTGSAAGSDARILVVEDHAVNRLLLERQISVLGYHVELAVDGCEALEKLRNNRYDLVLTDCHMPNMDGYQLTREIRAMESARKSAPMPIIACTANALPADAALCLETGMNDYLSKPVSIGELRQKLVRWLKPAESDNGKQPLTDAQSPPEPGQSGEPLDPAALLPYTGGDPGLRDDILSQFLAAHIDDMSELSPVADCMDAEKIARATHRIKGAARMIGALPLATAAEEVEKAARSGLLDAACGLLPKLSGETARLEQFIKKSAGTG